MGAELATTADTVMTAETEPRVELKADQKAETVERAELKAEHELIAELRAELGRKAVLEGWKSRHGCHLDYYTLNERKSRHGCHLHYYTPNEWQDLKKCRHDQLRDRTLTSAILSALGSPTRTQAKISPFSGTEDVLTSRSLRERGLRRRGWKVWQALRSLRSRRRSTGLRMLRLLVLRAARSSGRAATKHI